MLRADAKWLKTPVSDIESLYFECPRWSTTPDCFPTILSLNTWKKENHEQGRKKNHEPHRALARNHTNGRNKEGKQGKYILIFSHFL
jgi:hypothetical protein